VDKDSVKLFYLIVFYGQRLLSIMSYNRVPIGNDIDAKWVYRQRWIIAVICILLVGVIIFAIVMTVTNSNRIDNIVVVPSSKKIAKENTDPTTPPAPQVCPSSDLFTLDDGYLVKTDFVRRYNTTIGNVGTDIKFLFNTPDHTLFGIVPDTFALYVVSQETGQLSFVCQNKTFSISSSFGSPNGKTLFATNGTALLEIHLQTCVATFVYNLTATFGTIVDNHLFYVCDDTLIQTPLYTHDPRKVERFDKTHVLAYCPNGDKTVLRPFNGVSSCWCKYSRIEKSFPTIRTESIGWIIIGWVVFCVVLGCTLMLYLYLDCGHKQKHAYKALF